MLPLIVGALEDHSQPDPAPLPDEDDVAAEVVEAEIVPDTDTGQPEKPKPDYATKMAEESDDMDGIIGDINTVPQIDRP